MGIVSGKVRERDVDLGDIEHLNQAFLSIIRFVKRNQSNAATMRTFAFRSLGLTGIDSKMKDTVSKSGIEWHLVTKPFKL